MCGRFVSTSTPDAIADYFGATATVAPLDANFNVAPTHAVYGVVARATDPDTPLDKTVRAFRWGTDPKLGQRSPNWRPDDQRPCRDAQTKAVVSGFSEEQACDHPHGRVLRMETGRR